MSVIYKVRTKHTQELLKDFVKFSFRVNHPKATLQLCVIGVGLTIIGMAMEKGSTGMWVSLVVGILICVFAFTRHHIGIMRLKGNDDIYKNDWEVEVSFSNHEIRIWNSGEEKVISEPYRKVAALYMDEKNYYIGIEGDNLYPLPRKAFVEGDQESFEDFIRRKTNQKILYAPIKIKNKFTIIRERMKMQEEEHDRRIQEQRKKR